MGEMSNHVIDGFQCSGCGTCFTGPHGYPVLCRECWADYSRAERRPYSKATLPQLGEEHDRKGIER
jgi:hypothetical protein